MKLLLDALGIEIVVVSSEKAVATMPVQNAIRQFFMGASVVLAETVANVGS